MSEAIRDMIQSMWASGSVLIYFPAFLGGVLVSFTPCVYPVVPIVVSVVTANAQGRIRRAFALSVTYALAIALVYSILGVVVGLTGGIFGTWVNSPVVQLVVGGFFVAMGLWMLELFDIPLPAFLTQHQGAAVGGFAATFVAGLVSALVIGPCTGPVLFAMLGLIGSSADAAGSPLGSAIYGGTVMFAFSAGMTLLLVAAGTFSGVLTSLPRPGGWMNVVKKAFGVIMILVGGYFIVQMIRTALA